MFFYDRFSSQNLVFVIPEFLFFFIVGLVLGSFATALIHRIPRGISWVYDKKKSNACRSKCNDCGHELNTFDLIPLFSWLFFKGHCRYCQTKILTLYPTVELISALSCVIANVVLGQSLALLFILIALPFLIALAFIDLKHYILPNQLVGILGGIGCIYILTIWYYDITDWDVIFYSHFLGMIVYTAFSWMLGIIASKMLKKEALGFGDVKFFAIAGLWLGLSSFSYFLIVSGVIGTLLALVWQKIQKTNIFPFGPALIIAFYVLFLFQN